MEWNYRCLQCNGRNVTYMVCLAIFGMNTGGVNAIISYMKLELKKVELICNEKSVMSCHMKQIAITKKYQPFPLLPIPELRQ